jgi:protein arginine kinase activator
MNENLEPDSTTCERCQKQPASVRIRRVAEGQEENVHVCKDCAREMGVEKVAGDDPVFLSDPVTVMFKSMEETAESGAVCRGCGITFERFRETGRLGCATCYESFASEIGKLLRRIHGASEHRGKSPAREGTRADEAARIRRLNEELERAVTDEDYERAAELRDRLRQFEPTRSNGEA